MSLPYKDGRAPRQAKDWCAKLILLRALMPIIFLRPLGRRSRLV